MQHSCQVNPSKQGYACDTGSSEQGRWEITALKTAVLPAITGFLGESLLERLREMRAARKERPGGGRMEIRLPSSRAQRVGMPVAPGNNNDVPEMRGRAKAEHHCAPVIQQQHKPQGCGMTTLQPSEPQRLARWDCLWQPESWACHPGMAKLSQLGRTPWETWQSAQKLRSTSHVQVHGVQFVPYESNE